MLPTLAAGLATGRRPRPARLPGLGAQGWCTGGLHEGICQPPGFGAREQHRPASVSVLRVEVDAVRNPPENGSADIGPRWVSPGGRRDPLDDAVPRFRRRRIDASATRDSELESIAALDRRHSP